MGVDAAFGEEDFVGASFCDAVFCDDDDLVRVADCGQTVRDGNGGAVFGEFFKALLYPTLALVVQCAGGLIKYEDGRVL